MPSWPLSEPMRARVAVYPHIHCKSAKVRRSPEPGSSYHMLPREDELEIVPRCKVVPTSTMRDYTLRMLQFCHIPHSPIS